jgi:predicted nucleic acid-binding protein
MTLAVASQTSYFLDSSALAKRYVAETGTAWTLDLADPGANFLLIVAHIGLVEVAAALASKHRGGVMSTDQYEHALDDLVEDAGDQYTLVHVTQTLVDLAIDLTRRHKLRGYDAVQLASALTANSALMADGFPTLVFVSADDDLLVAATAEGLATENPNTHS